VSKDEVRLGGRFDSDEMKVGRIVHRRSPAIARP